MDFTREAVIEEKIQQIRTLDIVPRAVLHSFWLRHCIETDDPGFEPGTIYYNFSLVVKNLLEDIEQGLSVTNTEFRSGWESILTQEVLQDLIAQGFVYQCRPPEDILDDKPLLQDEEGESYALTWLTIPALTAIQTVEGKIIEKLQH